MEATRTLMREHRLIERVIRALDNAVACLEQGQEVRPGFFMDCADFISGFADGCHHKKEEGVLFQAMAENGVPVKHGPVGVMMHEHEQGREFTRALRAAAGSLATDPWARHAVIRNARGYASLMRLHIMKEDQVLFPMADQFIPAGSQEQVMEGFTRIEHHEAGHESYDKYLLLADELDLEAARLLMEA